MAEEDNEKEQKRSKEQHVASRKARFASYRSFEDSTSMYDATFPTPTPTPTKEEEKEKEYSVVNSVVKQVFSSPYSESSPTKYYDSFASPDGSNYSSPQRPVSNRKLSPDNRNYKDSHAIDTNSTACYYNFEPVGEGRSRGMVDDSRGSTSSVYSSYYEEQTLKKMSDLMLSTYKCYDDILVHGPPSILNTNGKRDIFYPCTAVEDNIPTTATTVTKEQTQNSNETNEEEEDQSTTILQSKIDGLRKKQSNSGFFANLHDDSYRNLEDFNNLVDDCYLTRGDPFCDEYAVQLALHGATPHVEVEEEDMIRSDPEDDQEDTSNAVADLDSFVRASGTTSSNGKNSSNNNEVLLYYDYESTESSSGGHHPSSSSSSSAQQKEDDCASTSSTSNGEDDSSSLLSHDLTSNDSDQPSIVHTEDYPNECIATKEHGISSNNSVDTTATASSIQKECESQLEKDASFNSNKQPSDCNYSLEEQGDHLNDDGIIRIPQSNNCDHPLTHSNTSAIEETNQITNYIDYDDAVLPDYIHNNILTHYENDLEQQLTSSSHTSHVSLTKEDNKEEEMTSSDAVLSNNTNEKCLSNKSVYRLDRFSLLRYLSDENMKCSVSFSSSSLENTEIHENPIEEQTPIPSDYNVITANVSDDIKDTAEEVSIPINTYYNDASACIDHAIPAQGEEINNAPTGTDSLEIIQSRNNTQPPNDTRKEDDLRITTSNKISKRQDTTKQANNDNDQISSHGNEQPQTTSDEIPPITEPIHNDDRIDCASSDDTQQNNTIHTEESYHSTSASTSTHSNSDSNCSTVTDAYEFTDEFEGEQDSTPKEDDNAMLGISRDDYNSYDYEDKVQFNFLRNLDKSYEHSFHLYDDNEDEEEGDDDNELDDVLATRATTKTIPNESICDDDESDDDDDNDDIMPFERFGYAEQEEELGAFPTTCMRSLQHGITSLPTIIEQDDDHDSTADTYEEVSGKSSKDDLNYFQDLEKGTVVFKEDEDADADDDDEVVAINVGDDQDNCMDGKENINKNQFQKEDEDTTKLIMEGNVQHIDLIHDQTVNNDVVVVEHHDKNKHTDITNQLTSMEEEKHLNSKNNHGTDAAIVIVQEKLEKDDTNPNSFVKNVHCDEDILVSLALLQEKNNLHNETDPSLVSIDEENQNDKEDHRSIVDTTLDEKQDDRCDETIHPGVASINEEQDGDKVCNETINHYETTKLQAAVVSSEDEEDHPNEKDHDSIVPSSSGATLEENEMNPPFSGKQERNDKFHCDHNSDVATAVLHEKNDHQDINLPVSIDDNDPKDEMNDDNENTAIVATLQHKNDDCTTNQPAFMKKQQDQNDKNYHNDDYEIAIAAAIATTAVVATNTAAVITTIPEENTSEDYDNEAKPTTTNSTTQGENEETKDDPSLTTNIDRELIYNPLEAIPNTHHNNNNDDEIDDDAVVPTDTTITNLNFRTTSEEEEENIDDDDWEEGSSTSSSSNESVDGFFGDTSNSFELLQEEEYDDNDDHDTIQTLMIASKAAALYLSKLLSSTTNNAVPISKRFVGIDENSPYASILTKQFQRKKFTTDTIDSTKLHHPKQKEQKDSTNYYFDIAAFVLNDNDHKEKWIHGIKFLQQSIVNGGYFILFLMLSPGASSTTSGTNNNVGIEKYGFSFKTWGSEPIVIYEDDELLVLCLPKRSCLVNITSCPWKLSTSIPSSSSTITTASSSNHHQRTSLKYEYDILSQVTITSPAIEYRNPTYNTLLQQCSITKAVNALQTHGFCILKNVIPVNKVHSFNQAVTKDVNEIRNIIKQKHGAIDIFKDDHYHHPILSDKESNYFSEMRIKDDLRVELRDGPNVKEAFTDSLDWIQLSNNCLIDIITKVMNPLEEDDIDDSNDEDEQEQKLRKDLQNNYKNASFPKINNNKNDNSSLRMDSIGFLISFPKCKDEEIKTDTPHLFQNYHYKRRNYNKKDLPPHSITAYIPTTTSTTQLQSNGSNPIGGTAFIAGSHLSIKNNTYLKNKNQLNNNVIRPSIIPGDILLFDCRILHFGLANDTTSTTKDWNNILYLNWMKSWFIDPNKEHKWNDKDNHCLFLDC